MQTRIFTGPVKIMERLGAANATRIITISEYSAKAIRQYLRATADRIDVIPLAGRASSLPTGALAAPRRSDLFLAMGEARADLVFKLAGRANGQDLLWRTTGGEQWANSWLLQIDRPAADSVKIFATVPTLSAVQMCEVVTRLGDDVVVHTSDPVAKSDLTAACPAAQFTIVEGEY